MVWMYEYHSVVVLVVVFLESFFSRTTFGKGFSLLISQVFSTRAYFMRIRLVYLEYRMAISKNETSKNVTLTK